MDILNARVALRERGLLDVLDLAVRFVVAHAKIYARLCALVLLPAAVLTTWGATQIDAPIGWLLLVASSWFVQIPFTVLPGRLVFEDRVRLRDVLRGALTVLPRAMGLRILQMGAIVIGGFLCILPGIWLAAAWLFANEVLILEGSRPIATLTRARRLVDRRFSEGATALVALVVLHAAFTVIGDVAGRTIVGELLQVSTPESIFVHGAPTVLACIGFWLFVPFAATARFLVYLDLRTRSEAWDVQTRFAALAARLHADEHGEATS